MRTSVFKFGGSSVGSVEAFRHCAGIMVANRDAGSRTVGVLSAMFGVTNRLLDTVKAAAAGDKATVAKTRAALLDAHVRTAKGLCTQPAIAADACEYIHATMQRCVDDVCRDVAGKGGADAWDTDLASSVGERWSTRIMSAHMRDAGHDAPFLDAVDVIVTDGMAGNAKPILEDTRTRVDRLVAPVLQRGGVALVTGFYGGGAADGRLTTLGRGGSDLSAAVLGHCLDAHEVCLYKVEYTTCPDGWMERWTEGWVGIVHDADPSTTIPSLHYEEARELAHFHKKVLHPETVSPAVEKAIPIAVRNTYDPAHPGTRIEAVVHGSAGNAAAAAAAAAAASHCGGPANLAAAIAGGAPRPVEARVQTVTRVPLRAYEAKNAPIHDLDLAALNVKREEAALVALVGLGIMSIPGLQERVTAVLRGAGIPVYVPSRVNGSPHNFSVIVPESARNAAVQLLHQEFIQLEAHRAHGQAHAVSGAHRRGVAAAASAAVSQQGAAAAQPKLQHSATQ